MRNVKSTARNILIMFFSLGLIGCSFFTHYSNLSFEMINKRDLSGMTKEQIQEKYGSPDYSSISYFGSDKMEHWTYHHAGVSGGPSGTLELAFRNGVVINTSYY